MSTVTASEFTTRIVTALLVAGVIAGFTFSGSRASQEDLERVESHSEEAIARVHVDIESIEEKLDSIESVVVETRIEQAAFQAEIREALRRGEER